MLAESLALPLERTIFDASLDPAPRLIQLPLDTVATAPGSRRNTKSERFKSARSLDRLPGHLTATRAHEGQPDAPVRLPAKEAVMTVVRAGSAAVAPRTSIPHASHPAIRHPGLSVLSAGPTPHGAGAVGLFDRALDEPRGWTWEEFRALPSEEITRDIHCVTKWSKLDTVGEASRSTRCRRTETSAEYVTAYSDGGYTTNLPLEDVTAAKRGWSSPTKVNRSRPSTAALRMLVPHHYFWKSAKWVRDPAPIDRRARLWRQTATTTTETHGRNSATRATDLVVLAELVEVVAETPRRATIVFDVPGWLATGPASTSTFGRRRRTLSGGRSYSIASASDGTRVALTVQGSTTAKSPYLTDEPGRATDRTAWPDRRLLVWEPPEAARSCSWLADRESCR